jgi:hypothetical protein
MGKTYDTLFDLRNLPENPMYVPSRLIRRKLLGEVESLINGDTFSEFGRPDNFVNPEAKNISIYCWKAIHIPSLGIRSDELINLSLIRSDTSYQLASEFSYRSSIRTLFYYIPSREKICR